jgi:hypothetical protein
MQQVSHLLEAPVNAVSPDRRVRAAVRRAMAAICSMTGGTDAYDSV